MAEDIEIRGRSRVLLWIGMVVIGLPLLYVLSIGPAAVIVTKVPSIERPAEAFYFPLVWLHDHTFLEDPLEAYVLFWVGVARRI